jgi:serine phosphatase RsbU (regulator of sigma subunit)
MADEKKQRYRLFKMLLVLGGVLAVLLLAQTVRSYRYVTQRLIEEELYREGARQASFVLETAREAGIQTPEEFSPVLERVIENRQREIAWLRIRNLRGDTIAESGASAGVPFPVQELRRLLETGDRVVRIEETSAGRVLVNVRPLRFRWSGSRRVPPEGERRGGPLLIEMGLLWEGVAPEFGGLQRAMIIQVLAAIALLGSMIFIGIRFRNFLRGKQLEQQLELARTVQQDLLPDTHVAFNDLDVSAICEPAWQVGGDFYDVLDSASDRVTIILGDVSGKGLPAALLMSMLHGAIRCSHPSDDPMDIENATQRLNQIICDATSVERFVTMFWCQYDADSEMLRYVNAGHLAPYVVHRQNTDEPTYCRLAEGGPVLGVIPGAPYQQGVVPFRRGDLLVLYSDGVVEAANAQEEEFGEERLAEVIQRNASRPAIVVRDAILSEIRKFARGTPQADDLTLMVVRAGAPVSANESVEQAQLQAV